MVEISEPEFSVDGLKESLRAGLASAPCATDSPAPEVPSAQDPPDNSAHTVSPREARAIALQPDFRPREDDRYHVNDLLQYHDRRFVQNAYLAILKRGPDATGFKAFTEGLRSGRLNKLDVLARLRYSAEGRAKKVGVEGLLVPAVVRRAYRVPVIGYLLQLSVALARLPVAVRSQQQFEAHVLAQQEQLAEHANAVSADLAGHSRETASRLARLAQTLDEAERRQQQRIDTLAQEQRAAREEIQRRLGDLHTHFDARLDEANKQFDARLDGVNEHFDARLSEMNLHFDTRLSEVHVHFDTRMDEMNQHFDTRLNGLHGHFETRLDKEADERVRDRQFLEARAEEVRAESSARAERLEVRLSVENARRREEAAALARNLQEEAERAEERRQQLRTELTLHGRRVNRLLEGSAGQPAAVPDRRQLESFADEERHNLDAFYLSLEDQFRGGREEIKSRLEIYLPILSAAGVGTEEMPVLDLGSGRGEWLELLRGRGMKARGVDQNRALIEETRALGLDVTEADVIDYLRGLPGESLGAVTGFHIVEHLPVEVLLKMLDEAVRVLKPRGAVIFETPNPQNVLVGSCNFYFDPTHRNPLPAPVMRFFVESRGFARTRVIELNPSTAERVRGEGDLVERFNKYFYGPMDYAVVGWKVSSEQ